MDHFFSEVAHEIKKPSKKDYLTLPALVIQQMQRQGAEVGIYEMKCSRKGCSKKNPLDNLFKNKTLDLQEYRAAQRYQNMYKKSLDLNYAKPRAYDLANSGRSTKPFELTPAEDKTDARSYIFAARLKMRLASNYETVKANGTFKIVELELPKILSLIFEQEIALRNLEKILHLTHSTIEERVKLICKILVEL